MLTSAPAFYLASKEALQLPIEFVAVDTGAFSAEGVLSVLQNSFERRVIKFVGEGYIEELAFSGLPNGETD